MKKNTKMIFLGILIVGLIVFLSGMAMAGSEVSISGVINEDGQLVDNSGMTYDISESDEGNELMEMTGQKVTVNGYTIKTGSGLGLVVEGSCATHDR